MTAELAASSLHATLRAADVPLPFILVGHSIAGLTTRLYVGEHPDAVAGVVLFDPTVPSFARMFDEDEFQPRWDGTASADQVEQVTSWPDIPFEILLHDPAVYARGQIWSETVEAQWGTDEAPFAALAPGGNVGSFKDRVTTSTKTPKMFLSLPSGSYSTQSSRRTDGRSNVFIPTLQPTGLGVASVPRSRRSTRRPGRRADGPG